MQLEDFLSRLRVARRSGKETICHCPVPSHIDKNPSFSVCETVTRAGSRFPGLRKIQFVCSAGCSYDAVMNAMGLDWSDLYIDPLPDDWKSAKARPIEDKRSGSSGAEATAVQETSGWRPKSYMSYEAATGRLGRIEAVYDYCDKSGNHCLSVVRLRQADGKKTFRQFRRVDPAREFPIVAETKSLSPEQRYTLYKAPGVARAIEDGTRVLVVEGEKDVETLERLGYVATCNAGGASSKPGDNKWTQYHAAALKGADVLVIPDQDDAGKRHGEIVAKSLSGLAKSVRVIQLKDHWPECPPKGDVSDMVAAKGEEGAKSVLEKMIAAAEAPIDGDFRAAVETINGVPGYGARNDGMYYWTSDGEQRKLCNFVALPKTEVRLDNGQDIRIDYIIDGWDRYGKHYPEARVNQERYTDKNMRWLVESWGMGATCLPGNGIAAKVQYLINEAGYRTVKTTTEYTHTGWRVIDGKLSYLYQGGAIGVEGINVALRGSIARYSLERGAEHSWRDGAACSWSLREVMSKRIFVPLMAVMFLAPLRHFLQMEGCTPTFALYLLGTTGSHKTTATCLALSHYGDFRHNEPKPATFADSINGVRGMMFALKDMPLLIDDFKPVNSMTEKKKMDDMAQALVRSFGDGAGRTVMNADRTIKESFPPRCVGVMTGEMLPAIEQSGLERLYIVEMRKKDAAGGEEDLPLTEQLTQAQDKAREGLLQASMRGYIKWLAKQADDLPGYLCSAFRTLRAQAMKRPGARHDRSPEVVAHMMLGYSTFLRYLRDAEILDDAGMAAEIDSAWDTLLQESDRHAQVVQEDAPVARFVDALRDLMASGGLAARKTTDTGVLTNMVGYKDEYYYYLLPDLLYQKVAEFYSKQGIALLSKRQLYEQMASRGLVREDEANGRTTRPKKIDGKTQRVLWIPRSVLDGTPDSEQESFIKIDDDNVF